MQAHTGRPPFRTLWLLFIGQLQPLTVGVGAQFVVLRKSGGRKGSMFLECMDKQGAAALLTPQTTPGVSWYLRQLLIWSEAQ